LIFALKIWGEKSMSLLWRTLVTLVLLHESFSRKFSPGPSVDPGVFVITHISTCRNGAGYCILGFSCEVDKDFAKDDLGGHCRGLGAAFNPKAQFVCCRENPDLHPPRDIPTPPTLHEVNLEVTSTSVVTEEVTEIVTEIEPVTEIVMVTKVEEVTEVMPDEVSTEVMNKPGVEITTEEVLKPGIVLDADIEEEKDCVTAALLGLDCKKRSDSLPKKSRKIRRPRIIRQSIYFNFNLQWR